MAFPIILTTSGVLIIATALRHQLKWRKQLRKSHATVGRFVEYYVEEGERGNWHYPVIEYSNHDGETCRFRSEHPCFSSFEPGQELPIIIDNESGKAEYYANSARLALVGLAVVTGSVFLAVGVSELRKHF